MNVSEQGTRKADKYRAIPRTLIFVIGANPDTGKQEILLIKGGPEKRLWANRYNGLGGHVEVYEDVRASALRELKEESGLAPAHIVLRGIVNIDVGQDEHGPFPGVMMFVFLVETHVREVCVSEEGALEWVAVDQLEGLPLVDDLHEVIPRALDGGPLFFGHYQPDAGGKTLYQFDRDVSARRL